jgi:hypothetical protein
MTCTRRATGLTSTTHTTGRPALAVGIGLALLLVACDPGYSLSARNDGASAIVIRLGTDKWLVPAHGSGIVFSTLGLPKDATPRDYEVLDAATCKGIGVQHIDWATNADPIIVVGQDASIRLDRPTPAADIQLATSDLCPGPADGWGLAVVNSSAKSYYVRSRDGPIVVVARVGPRSNAMSVGGGATFSSATERSVIELLDLKCRVLDTYVRSGWGPFGAKVQGDHLIVQKGVTEQVGISDELVTDCGGTFPVPPPGAP